MTAGIYIRKSRESDGPAYRLEVQRESLPAYAKAQGWEPRIFDEGYASAARGASLPERDRLETEIRAGRVGIVLVIELTRLSRDETLEDYVRWLALCSEHGAKLATPSRCLDPAHSSDWMLLLLEGGFSSVEMRHLQKRMGEGRARAWEQGAYVGGSIPAGYRRENGRIVLVPEEAERVRSALEAVTVAPSLRQAAHKTGIAYHRLRRWITEDLLLWWVARRPSRERPGEWVRCQWEPVIDEALADRVRLARGKMRDRGEPARTRRYLLTGLGLLECGYCGGRVKASPSGHARTDGTLLAHYGCYSADRATWRCRPEARGHPVPEIDAGVIRHVLHTLSRVEALEDHYRQKQPRPGLDALADRERHLLAQRKRLVEAVGLGVIPFDAARARTDELAAGLAAVEAEREEALAADDAPPDWKALANLRDRWEALDRVARRDLLSALLEKIRLFDTYCILHYRIPLDAAGRTKARFRLERGTQGRRRWEPEPERTASTARKNRGSCTAGEVIRLRRAGRN